MRTLVFVSFFLINIGSYCSNIINVGVSRSVKSIKNAIQIANESDVIIIDSGVYKENDITINKKIHLKGESGAIIDCEMKNGITVLSADSIFIENLNIKNIGISFINDYSAIRLKKCNYFNLKNNLIENVFFGIFIEKSKHGNISDNIIKSSAKSEFNSGNGIHLLYCSNIKIFNNNLDNLRDGIYLEFVDNSEINDNISINNLRYGLHFMFSNNDEYHGNKFANNGAGVAVMFSKFIKMYNNIFYKNWGNSSYGLLLKEIYDGNIYNNLFEENTIGINVEGSNRIIYKNNDFKSNGWAVKIQGGCYNNTFTKNNFISNTFDVSYSGNINENLFNENYWSQYTGYDLDKNNIGDIPYRPVKLFSYIINNNPESIILLRSLFIDIINFSEKVSPVFTPDNLIDNKPLMKKIIY